MPCLLHDETPLVSQLNLTHGFPTPRAVYLARAGVTLLRSTAVLDSSAVTHQVEARRLSLAVVARPELHDPVSLVLSHSLYGSQEVFE